ncbi:AT hook motif protein [Cryptosporidium ryanae]|uniref:AT hook motif protein n=1 Tax=Cryptosporidium ryanae TaxID=515981 RepID=UPI00351A3B90|nr:AT hook motif protein [Cryptosporidium ryanae]
MNISKNILKFFLLFVIIRICAAKRYFTIDINGVKNKNGYYSINIYIGTPPQKQSLIIDTGSSHISLSCSTCYNCAIHEYPTFNLLKSKSGLWCKNKEFKVDFCKYTHQFGEGSIISGRYFSDVLSFYGGKKQYKLRDKNYFKYDFIGCNEFETKNFLKQNANGIIGMGLKKNIYGYNIVTEILKSAKRILNISSGDMVISLCLLIDSGTMNIGELNDDIIEENITEEGINKGTIYWIPLVTPSNLYNIYFQEIIFHIDNNDEKVYTDKISAIIDVGSTFTYLPKKLFNLLINKFSQICNRTNKIELGICIVLNNSFCWRNVTRIYNSFPIIKIKFKGQNQIINWEYQSYLYSYEKNLWCLGIKEQNVGQVNSIILGISFLINRQIILDPSKKRVGLNGFIINKCNKRSYIKN